MNSTFTLILLLCGSVQTNFASFTSDFPNPFIFFTRIAKSSELSLSQFIHGGLSYLWQQVQQSCSSPGYRRFQLSMAERVQVGQILEESGVNLSPQRGHSIDAFCWGLSFWSTNIWDKELQRKQINEGQSHQQYTLEQEVAFRRGDRNCPLSRIYLMIASSRYLSSLSFTISVQRRSTMSTRSASLKSFRSSISLFMASQTVLYFSISTANSSFILSISSFFMASCSLSQIILIEESVFPSQPSCSCNSFVSFSYKSSKFLSFCQSLFFKSRFYQQRRPQIVSEGSLPASAIKLRCTYTIGLRGNSLCVISESFPKFNQAPSKISDNSATPAWSAHDLASERLLKMRAVISRRGSHPERSCTMQSVYVSMARAPANWRYLREIGSSQRRISFSLALRSLVYARRVKLLERH